MANTTKFLELRQLRPLRLIGNSLLAGLPGRREAPLQVRDVTIRDVDAERPDCRVVADGSARRGRRDADEGLRRRSAR